MRLVIDRVRARRGAFTVGPVAAELDAGDCLALVGANGAGKTTLLETFAGFFPVASGRLLLAGADIGDLPPERRHMAYLPQDLALFPHLDVVENVGFATRSRHRDWRGEARQLIAEFGLSAISACHPHQLSRGQAQRVAFARALAARPSILLLDEPAASLDLPGRQSFRAYMRKLMVEHGATLIYATHNVLDSLSLATCVVVLDGGRVIQAGSPDTLFREPATVRVAELFGITNVWPATVAGNTGAIIRVCTGGCGLACAPQPIPAAALCVAIGPGEVELCDGDAGDSTNCFKATVRALQVSGETALLDLDAGLGSVRVAVAPWRARRLTMGEVVRVRLPPARLRLVAAG